MSMDRRIAALLMAAIPAMGFASDGWRPLFAPDYSDGDFDPAVWHTDGDGNLTAEKDVAYWTKDDYSNFEVECGVSKGYDPIDTPRYRLMWMDVPYEPGEVKAVAYGPDGKILGEEILRTAGEPVRVVLTPERRYGSLCVVKVTLADRNGTPVPESGRRIRFAAAGCTIAAVGNSDPCGKDSFKAVDSHPLCAGRAAVYLRLKDGQVGHMSASAEGLELAEVEIR